MTLYVHGTYEAVGDYCELSKTALEAACYVSTCGVHSCLNTEGVAN